MSCNICNEGVSKYKCPSCRIPYCSIPCWKTHKDEGCNKGTHSSRTAVAAAVTSNGLDSEARKPTYQFPTEDTVPPERLKLLGDNEQLKSILCNPHVQAILTTLDKAENPRKIIQEAMQEPIFVEFVDECMKTIDPPTQEELDEAMLQL